MTEAASTQELESGSNIDEQVGTKNAEKIDKDISEHGVDLNQSDSCSEESLEVQFILSSHQQNETKDQQTYPKEIQFEQNCNGTNIEENPFDYFDKGPPLPMPRTVFLSRAKEELSDEVFAFLELFFSFFLGAFINDVDVTQI